MMKQIFKRLIAVASSVVMCVSMSGGMVSADEKIHSQNDMHPISSKAIAQVCSINEEPLLSTYASLPDSVDLSDSNYFPDVGYQYGGTCSSWASTYYQFTYHANKFSNIVTNAQNTYSPTWTHIFYSNSLLSGITLTEAYNVLKNQGALTYADCPYDNTTTNVQWPTDTETMIKALETKVTTANVAQINTTVSKITNSKDAKLNTVKNLLNNGYILTFSTESTNKWAMKYTTDWEVAAYRAADANGGHSMAIVGYDDTIQCDINGDGIIEASETGAFKAVNSYGGWKNNGFIWIMYDALNIVSANSVSEANWRGTLVDGSLSGSRVAIFDYQDDNNLNYLYYINIAKNPVYLVGMLTFSSDYRYNMEISVNRGKSYQANSDKIVYGGSRLIDETTKTPYNNTLVVDYSSFDDAFPNFANGFNWYIKLLNKSENGDINNVSYKITDNKGNVVRDFGRIATTISKNGGSILDYELLNLQIGDVNYSETLTDEDAQIILRIAAGWTGASDLQILFADYNEDGIVNSRDAARLRMDLSSPEAAEFDASIAEMYHQIQSNARTMSIDVEGVEYSKYVEIITELYYEFVSGV